MLKRTLALLVVLGACGKSDLKGRAKYLTGSDAFVWDSDMRFHVREQSAMWGEVYDTEGAFHALLKGFPPGTTMSVDTKQATVDDGGSAQLEAPAASFWGGLAFDKIEHDAPTDYVVLVLQAPGGAPIQLHAPPRAASSDLTKMLFGVTSGPVLFGSEPPDTGKVHNIVWLDSASSMRAFGRRPATMRDIDALALVERLDGPKKTCTGFTRDGKPAPDVELTLSPTKITIYARRTGKPITTNVIHADETCPTIAWGEKNRLAAATSELPEAALEELFASQLATD